ncbi:hypothetical protein AYO45_04810 [Gammaproteobacteria bacterium SCGC AG-212-F23]|nr:hypothetical protein AYO45_04810 [Gammaproteobacteria bacterium SCGC AG-212-F23]
MTPYDIQITLKAANQIKSLSTKSLKQMIALIEALSINPRPPGSKKILGMTGLYSESVEEFRLVYKVEEQEILILFLAQAH